MDKFESWEEVTYGMFCYENYEILIRYWNSSKDGLSAKADLYFLYDNHSEAKDVIKRDKIYHGTVAGCLVAAVEYERRLK